MTYNSALKYDEKVLKLLHSFGLTDTECSLYLAGLGKPGATVSELITIVGINRTTAYHALNTLRQKGFATEAKLQGKLIYNMTKPHDLRAYLERRYATLETQRHQLKQLSPLFPSLETDVQIGTSVEKFEGIEGVKEAIDRALYCKGREWRIIAPKSNFFSQMEAEYATYFMKTRRERGIKAYSLWEAYHTPSHLSLRDLLERRPRYLPKELAGRFTSVTILYDDKALFVSTAHNPRAVIVESAELTGTLRVMFDGLWSLAQKPEAYHP